MIVSPRLIWTSATQFRFAITCKRSSLISSSNFRNDADPFPGSEQCLVEAQKSEVRLYDHRLARPKKANRNYAGGFYMKESLNLIRLLMMIGAVVVLTGYGSPQQQPLQLAGAPCATPPFLHCPDKDCPPDRVINPGPVVEMKSRRTYFLDYPCDLKPGEKVTFILSLHGFGSYGNWQRHYFPILDYKDKYRLVIATPNSPTRAWSAADDEYLQNIVSSVVDQIGRENIKAFWLAGHSQGGMTSNRIVRTEFFKDRVDGWLSLSGGRLGGSPGRASSFGPPRGGA